MTNTANPGFQDLTGGGGSRGFCQRGVGVGVVKGIVFKKKKKRKLSVWDITNHRSAAIRGNENLHFKVNHYSYDDKVIYENKPTKTKQYFGTTLSCRLNHLLLYLFTYPSFTTDILMLFQLFLRCNITSIYV